MPIFLFIGNSTFYDKAAAKCIKRRPERSEKFSPLYCIVPQQERETSVLNKELLSIQKPEANTCLFRHSRHRRRTSLYFYTGIKAKKMVDPDGLDHAAGGVREHRRMQSEKRRATMKKNVRW